MTREEKINTLKAIIQECEEYQWQRKEILFEIIKDLEQEPILDKIKAEIFENSIEDYKYHGCGTDELIIETSEVLRILDKYKAESEKE